ncbi:chemotaxis protein CheX [Desulfobulbus alkaliphilus]|uniref:chemotaxis protein CheX n=1 Tax=Desulfobulbus alkaliphilus TaxID=869814 RepID=UPI001965ECC1|nr:chemotaxis protein CheX [Desulfobulbus alkaliphilus]MBM9537444.1 chemotaxis protein CheX [Desulfobulbus alkaliphilus]
MELEQFLIDATMEVFNSMVFIEVVPETSGKTEVLAVDTNLISCIGLAGDLKGVVAIHCPAAVALEITGAMLGMDIEELGEDCKDAIGEITNMVAGGLKTALAPFGSNVELAIPVTVIGSSFRISGLASATRVFVPFGTPCGRFGVELKYIFS